MDKNSYCLLLESGADSVGARCCVARTYSDTLGRSVTVAVVIDAVLYIALYALDVLGRLIISRHAIV